MIKNEDGKFYVYSHDGTRKLGGPYDSEEEAKKRLSEIEMHKNMKKEIYCPVLEFKEDSDTLVVKGYIATTHLDSGWQDDDGSIVRDRITKETLQKWADEINSGIPRANKVSVNHNRSPHVAGLGIPGSAKVIKFPDGEYGLYVETKIDKTREDYADILYRIKEGFLDSFSIEFTAPDDSKIQNGVRELSPNTELYGWTLASQPMNEYAVMMKEFYKISKIAIPQSHSDNLNQDVEAGKATMDIKEVTKPVVDVTLESVKEVIHMTETKESPAEVKQPQAEVKTDDSLKLEVKELKERMDKMVAEKPKLNETKEKPVSLEVKEYAAIFDKTSKVSVQEQFARAGRLANHLGLTNGIGEVKHNKAAESRQYKNFATNGYKLEYKGLSIGDNLNAAYVDDTSTVGISQAELQDVFDPVIYNALNEVTNLWNALQKDNKANSGSNRVEFVLKTAQNASAGAYTGNDIGTGNTSRMKFVTKFKKYKADFAVDGDMIAAARGGPIGDVLALEIQDATLALLSSINTALFAEVGLETASAVIGLEYVTDSAGNTSLYGVTRSAANKLAPDSASDNYFSGAGGNYKSLLRQGIRHCMKDGSMKQDLLIVCDHIQVDKIKETFDNALRLNSPTATRFGFETDVIFEGVPVLADKDCNDDDIFIVDTRHHRVALFVPPTVEMLGKRSDAEEGFIKTYFAVYNTAPRRMVQIHSCPTS